MKLQKDLFDIFEKDPNYRVIMKRLLEASMEESFNSIIITEARKGYPIVYVNPAFCKLTGYGSKEVIGMSPAILQGPKTDMDVIQKLGEDIVAGNVFHGQAVNYRKDGSEFVMEWKIAPIRNDNEDVTHYMAIQRDVTNQ